MKTKLILTTLIILLGIITESAFSNKPGKLTKVVIDAGHGGKDPGAIGGNSKEKDIALSIALKVGKLIEDNFSDVKVIYTRKTDVFVELYNRAKVANENHADLFISIHCNANKNKNAYGTETFVMGLHKSQANLEVAKKENSAVLLETDYTRKYDGFDPNSPEANIIFSLFQNAYLDQSLDLAGKVQQNFTDKLNTIDRGVKQAGLLVLYKTYMPGILVETGFITNKEEEEVLNSEKGQNNISTSIFNAFRDYKFQVEGFNNQAVITQHSKQDKDKEADKIVEPVKDKNNTQNQDVTHDKKNVIDTISKSVSVEVKPVAIQNKFSDSIEQVIIFRIQIASSSVNKQLNDPVFKGLKDVKQYYHNGLYKYTVGEEKSLKKANDLLYMLQDKGFKDAFIIAFLNNERISPTEALKIMNQQKGR